MRNILNTTLASLANPVLEEVLDHLDGHGYVLSEDNKCDFFVEVGPGIGFKVNVDFDDNISLLQFISHIASGQFPEYQMSELYILLNLFMVKFPGTNFTIGSMEDGTSIITIAVDSIVTDGSEKEALALMMVNHLKNVREEVFYPLLTFLKENEPVYFEGTPDMAPDISPKITALDVLEMLETGVFGHA